MNDIPNDFFQRVGEALKSNMDFIDMTKDEYFIGQSTYRHYDECLGLIPEMSFFVAEKQNFPKIGHCEKAVVVKHLECHRDLDAFDDSRKTVRHEMFFTVITERSMVTCFKVEITDRSAEVPYLNSTTTPVASKVFDSEDALFGELSKNRKIFTKFHGVMIGD